MAVPVETLDLWPRSGLVAPEVARHHPRRVQTLDLMQRIRPSGTTRILDQIVRCVARRAIRERERTCRSRQPRRPRRHMPSPGTRIEHDLLGALAVPADAYYGVQTARALDNFQIPGVELRLYPNFIKGLAMVKLAAARANHDTGGLSDEVLKGIEGACQELIDGKLHDQFKLDVFQGGAGTSTNMNANEVIANRALELMGHKKGEYKYCDPHDHVNRSQSTNDSYPTSMHIGLLLGNREIIAEFNKLIESLRAKGKEFSNILKMGRTQLQD